MKLADALRLRPKDVVTLVGGGGKTALMFRLADELVAAGSRVVTTMTTRIFVSQMSRAPLTLVLHGEGALLAQLPAALAEHGHVLIAGGTEVEQDKAQGVPPELVDRIAAQSAVDAVIVEADGSRRLPFKAPAPHEPVIPSGATIVVPVVGIDVVGRALAPGQVHRPQLVAELTGASLGDPVTPEIVATVLGHERGGAKGVPPDARLVPFINKVESAEALALGRQVARRLLAFPRVSQVLIGAAQAADPVQEVWSRVAAVVLAAGAGTRFGVLKQVLPWQGVPLVAHVADQALACPDVDRVVVTVGASARQVRTALGVRPVAVVEVLDWAAGQSRSVQAGLAAAINFGRRVNLLPQPASPLEPSTKVHGGSPLLGATLFLLADQPGVSADLISALVRCHRETLAPVVAPRYQGQRGNPVLFDSATFEEFDQLRGDIGARPVLERHQDRIAWVEWPTPEITQDIDAPEDYVSQGGTTDLPPLFPWTKSP